jgi:hypothetical protein
MESKRTFAGVSPPSVRQRALCRIWEGIESLEKSLREQGGVLDSADVEAIERLFEGLFRGLKSRVEESPVIRSGALVTHGPCPCGDLSCSYFGLGHRDRTA